VIFATRRAFTRAPRVARRWYFITRAPRVARRWYFITRGVLYGVLRVFYLLTVHHIKRNRSSVLRVDFENTKKIIKKLKFYFLKIHNIEITENSKIIFEFFKYFITPADVGMPFGYPRISILGPANYKGGLTQGLDKAGPAC
jgi:hypothetical protein